METLKKSLLYIVIMFILSQTVLAGNTFPDSCSSNPANYLLYDDFESGSINTSIWQVVGDASVINTVSYSGNYSLRCGTQAAGLCLESKNKFVTENTSALFYFASNANTTGTYTYSNGFTVIVGKNFGANTYVGEGTGVTGKYNYYDGAWKTLGIWHGIDNQSWDRHYWYTTGLTAGYPVYSINITNWVNQSVQTNYNPRNGVTVSWPANISIGTDSNAATPNDFFYDKIMVWNRTIYGDSCPQDAPASPPLITFFSQVPSSVSSTSIFTQFLNVTYNYSIVNLTSPQLNYSVTGLTCIESINGTCTLANNSAVVISQTSNATVGNNSLISYTLGENAVYPYVANLNSSYFNAAHGSFTDTVNTHATSIGFINMTTVNSYNILEVMADTIGQLRVYACNSSYSFSSSILSDVNCQEIGNINSTSYNHTHGAYSNHSIVPYTIINGRIGGTGITVTSNMSFLFKHISGTSQVFYVSNFSRINAVQTTGNNGVTWTADNTVTVDSHVHQYPISGVFINYRGQGTYNSVLNYTTTTQTQIQITQLAPTPPIITTPSAGGYNQATQYLNITYLNATPFINGSVITYYNITLLNSDFSLNRTIKSNNSLNNSYYWNVYDENLTTGDYNIRVCAFDNYTLSSCDIETFTLTKNAFLNVTLINALNSSVLANATLNITNLNLSTTETANTTNGTFILNIIKGTNYSLDVDAIGYAVTQSNYTSNASINQYKTISVYTTNSVYVNIFDEATNIRITGINISVVFTGVSVEYVLSTTNGELYTDNLIDGGYSVKLSGGNYTLKTYSITVNNRSTQTLNAYLSSNILTTYFRVYDQDTDANIDQAGFLMERLINASYVVVDSKNTDITGRVMVSYLANVKYRFTITKSGYTSKVFYLDPILFSSYNIPLKATNAQVNTNDVSITYYPNRFYNGQLNNFTWTINSPTGVLVNYSLNISFPGGYVNRSGVNANGQTFSFNFTISNASFYDKVNVSYEYYSTLRGLITSRAQYDITGSNVSGNYTIIRIIDQDYGLGWFEKVFITTLVAIVIAGFVYGMAGLGASLFSALMIYGIAAFLGFMPWWSVLITMLLGFVLIASDNKGGA